jgi:hypothetical protein
MKTTGLGATAQQTPKYRATIKLTKINFNITHLPSFI